jgi:basic membrane protein A
MVQLARTLVLCIASAVLVGACSVVRPTRAPTEEPTIAGPQPTEPSVYVDYKACIALDSRGSGDQGFNDLALKGLGDAAALGFDPLSSEPADATGYEANIQDLIDRGCRTVVTVGSDQTQATVAATLANPDISFAQVDAVWDEEANGPVPDNYTGLDFRIDEASALAGYLAAGVSRSHVLATFGGEATPIVQRAMSGLVAGANIYNARHDAKVKVLGWDAATGQGTFVGGNDPWDTPAQGQQLAESFLAREADVVYPVAGATGGGAIKAMAEAGKWAIGSDRDEALVSTQLATSILTSAEKRVDVAVLATLKKNAEGDMGGEDFVGTLANGGVALSPYHELDSEIPAALKDEVDQLRTEIESGAVTIADYLK